MQGGGGPVCVLRHDQTGKLASPPTISGHKGQVLDMAFSPFAPGMLATGSDDTTCKLWTIPDGGLTENMHADHALVELSGHAKKVGIVKWHPSAEGVLATSSIDKTVKIWNVETGQETFSVDDFPDYPTSLCWSYDGGMMAATTKAKQVSLIDPREQAIMSTSSSHPGAKSQRCLWLGNKNLLFTFGFSKQSGREIAVWDPKKMDAPVFKDELDVASGVIMPAYDPDLHVLYLGGKGDGNIRYFEVKDDSSLFFLSQFSGNPQAGMCMMPKRGCDTTKTEVAKIFKMEKTQITPVSFVLPRKGEQFHDDVYPNSAAPTAAISADEWAGGSTADPVLMSLNPDGGGAVAAAPVVKKASGMAGRVADLEKEVAELKAQLVAKDEEIAALKAGGATAPAPAPAVVAAPEPAPAPAADDDDDEPAE
jgi:coronin-1B/1C/6